MTTQPKRKMPTRRRLLTGAGTLAALSGVGLSPFALSSCSMTERESAGADAVTVGLTYIPNVQFCAFYLAVQKGLFGDLKVTLRHHGEQEGLFEALRLGREDVVFASADEALVAGGLSTIATSYQRYPAEVMIAQKGVRLEDLRGKTLGVPGRFGSSYFAALLALHTAGLTEQDVTLTEIGYTAVAALTTGKVDAIIGFTNNELVQLRGEGLEVTSLPVAPEQTLVGPSLVVLPERAKDPALAVIVDGMLEAEKQVVADLDAALEATAQQVPALADPVQRENAAKVLEATIALWHDPAGQLSVSVDAEAMTRMESFLRGAGVLTA